MLVLALVVWLPILNRAGAAVRDVRISGVTSTQAVLSYTAPDGGPCALEVSESPALKPLVHDVNPLLFPNAERDDRPGNAADGQARVFVMGKRAAEIGADGRRYSRALQVNSRHYYRIRCSVESADGNFQTANIPLGGTYGDVLPVDLQHPGWYAWPQFDWAAPDPKVIDPLTGLLFKPLSRPGKVTYRDNEAKIGSLLNVGTAGEWSQMSVSERDGAKAAYSGTQRSCLFLRTANFSIYGGASWSVDSGLDYVEIHLRAWGAAADEEDRKLEVCLTVNGISCASLVREVSIPTAEPKAFLTLGTKTPYLDFWSDALHVIPRPEAVRRNGTVTVDARGKAAHAGGDFFNPNWTAGSTIAIGNSECRMASVRNAIELVIDAKSCHPALSLPAARMNYAADNFGVLIRKKTASRHPISIKGAKLLFGWSHGPDWAYGGHTRFCADKPSSDRSNPVQYGYHCDIRGTFYWISPATGQARLLGQSWVSGMIGGDRLASRQLCGSDGATFAPHNPNVFYCTAATAAGQTVILRGEYTGGNEDAGDVPPGMGFVFPHTARPAVTWNNLTPEAAGRSLGRLIQKFDPAFDPALFSCGVRGVTGDGNLIFSCLRGGQDTIGWLGVFDPNARAVIAARPSWNQAPTRWCKIHTMQVPIGSERWLGFTPQWNDLGQTPGGGPWTTRILYSGSGERLEARPLAPCPPNPWGVTGDRCTTVMVEGEPCDLTPGAGEPRNCPYNPAAAFLMEAVPGDVFSLTQGGREYVRLLAKEGRRWVLERGFGWTAPAFHPPGSSLYALCGARRWDIDVEQITYWDYKADPHGNNSSGRAVVVDHSGFSHGFVSKQMIGGAPHWKECEETGCVALRTGADISDMLSRPPDRRPSLNPPFAGRIGVGSLVETYATFPPTAASAQNRPWFLHTRPVTSGSGLNRLTPVSGQLYRVSLAPGLSLHRKQTPTMAICGMHPLKDVSGPNSTIEDSSASAFQYCVADANGECQDSRGTRRTRTGDIFVNCPNVGVPLDDSCTGSAEARGVCLVDNGAYHQAIVQSGAGLPGQNGSESRVLSNGFRRYRLGEMYWNVRALSDGSWALVHVPWLNLGRTEALLAKLPPYPAPDSVFRGGFVPIPVKADPYQGASTALVEFGYAENGDPNRFYCTSRAETCIRGDQPGNDYGFARDGVRGVECASGCTISIPAIPRRVLYYRIQYRNVWGVRGHSRMFAVLVP